MKNPPEGWRRVLLGDLGSFKNGLNKEKEGFGHGLPFVNLMDVFGRSFLDESRFGLVNSTVAEQLSYSLKRGDVLFVRSSVKPEGVGLTTVVVKDLPQTTYSGFLIRYRSDGSIVASFKAHCFSSEPFRRELLRRSTISANTNINQEELNQLPLMLPGKDEQEGISAILSEWDKGVGVLADVVGAKRELKLGLMQRLLTGQTRFKGFVRSTQQVKTRYGGFPVDWAAAHIGDIADEVSEKNGGGHALPVLSCTKHRGLVNSLEYFGKRVFSADTSSYKVVRRGDFAYATNHVEEGSIGYQSLHDAALISPMYTVFRTRAAVYHSFFFKLVKTELYRHIFEVNTSGTIARRGGLRWDEFALIKVFLASMPEQIRIAAVLETCDREIELLQKQLEALREQKRGLMQKLLTGEVRVKVKG